MIVHSNKKLNLIISLLDLAVGLGLVFLMPKGTGLRFFLRILSFSFLLTSSLLILNLFRNEEVKPDPNYVHTTSQKIMLVCGLVVMLGAVLISVLSFYFDTPLNVVEQAPDKSVLALTIWGTILASLFFAIFLSGIFMTFSRHVYIASDLVIENNIGFILIGIFGILHIFLCLVYNIFVRIVLVRDRKKRK